MVLPDIGGFRERYEKLLSPLLETDVGKAWNASLASFSIEGIKVYEEIRRLADLANPAGGAVPIAGAVFSRGADFGLQALVRVEPGFLERVLAATTGPNPPPWTLQSGDQGLLISAFGLQLHGRIDGEGWLRVGLDPTALVGGRGAGAVFDGPLEKRIRDADMALFLKGGGQLVKTISGGMDPSPLSQMVKGVEGGAMTWSLSAGGTWEFEVALAAPVLKAFGPSLRKPDLDNVLARRWDEQATGFASLSIPPPALGMVQPVLDQGLANMPFAPPATVISALKRLEGRMGFVGFGAPGDWGLGVQFQDPDAASDMVRGLHAWLRTTLDKKPTKAAETLRLELVDPPSPGQPLLHISPDLAVSGVHVFASGPTLLVTGQGARHRRILDVESAAEGETTRSRFLQGPLTPELRAMLERPAMVVAYGVGSGDGGMFDLLAWILKPLEIAMEAFGTEIPGQADLEMEWVRSSLRRTGAAMVANGYLAQLFYDGAVSLDVADGVASIRVLMSML